MKRRDFICKSFVAGSLISNPIFAYRGQDPFFEIGLAQWSLNKSLKSGKIDNLDFARIAREKFDIGVVEYVNQFFINKAKNSGVDGILIVDLPPEVSNDLSLELDASEIDMIRLASPTTTIERMHNILKSSSGFIYYVSITGVTGSKINKILDIKKNYMFLKKVINIPFVIGFGINSPKKAHEISRYADGVVVGSDLIKEIEKGIETRSNIFNNVTNLVKKYNKAINK